MKKMIQEKINKSLQSIESLKSKISEIEKSDKYASEYKKKKVDELKTEIEATNDKLAEEIKSIFNARIDTLEAQKIIKGVDDSKVSSILSMLQIAKNSLSVEELQQLYNDNLDHTLLTRAIKGIAEERELPLEVKVNNIPELESLRDSFYRQLKTDGADTLKMSIQVAMLPDDL